MADDEKKPKSRREVVYDKGGKKGKEGRAKEEATEPKAEAKAEGDTPAAAAAPNMGEMHSKARMDLNKRHEGERKDFHGNQRDALRKMVQRHDKEIKALQAEHETAMAGAAAPAAPEAAAEPVAAPTAEA